MRYIQVLNRRHMAFEPPNEGACALSARLLHGLLAIFPQMHNVRPSMLSYEIREQLQQVIRDACELQVCHRRRISFTLFGGLGLNLGLLRRDCRKGLKAVDLHSLTHDERLAFFLNMYHALTIHACLQMGEPRSLLTLRSYMSSGLAVVST